MRILYYIYKRDFSRRYNTDLYKRSIYKTWSINKNYIKWRYKIYYSILKSLYSRTGNLSGNINSILSINRWINKESKLDIGTISYVTR